MIALDFPEFERPAKAISAPAGGGRPLGCATEISKTALRNSDMGRYIGETPPWQADVENSDRLG
ncbi:hypothetical protein [Sulfuritalea sp.]|uniref:hypothetical protein n=1 Tax=Sulfuritalea sp. TaxID=2480090 RepID=UPI0025FD1841|nr:hypothetical protein [Sulfuritalea sp.]